ncbi:MAG: DNA alkylation repair protein [Cyclobacteriaceae bacterium]
MINPLHQEILKLIQKNSGKPTQHTFLDSYLGNDHKRYPISAPALRAIAKEWMKAHRDLTPDEFAAMLTSLIEGVSSTEKVMAGILMGYSSKGQRAFDPKVFDQWLDHLVGWAEVDAVCTGDFTITQLPADWTKWKKLLIKLSKDPNTNKRRASLVLFCSPLSRIKDDRMAEVAFEITDKLRSEKEVLITKAISWLLRSMIKHYRESVSAYLKENAEQIPKIAVRETMVKLKTGKKTKSFLKK